MLVYMGKRKGNMRKKGVVQLDREFDLLLGSQNRFLVSDYQSFWMRRRRRCEG